MQTSTRWAGAALAVLLVLGGTGGVAGAARGGGGGGGGHHGGGFGGRGFGHGLGHGGGFHHGHHGFHHGPHVFIDGGFFFGFPLYGAYDPFYADPYYYPYPPYPPDDGPDYGPPPEPDDETTAEEPATYGLVQIRDVPDGAALDLDGRFWLTASGLDDRWLALPAGRHTIAVRPKDGAAATFDVDVEPGGRQTIDFADRD
jgi:hypothetical protein